MRGPAGHRMIYSIESSAGWSLHYGWLQIRSESASCKGKVPPLSRSELFRERRGLGVTFIMMVEDTGWQLLSLKKVPALSSRTSRSIDLSPILSDIKWSASGKVTEQIEVHLKSANPGNGPWCKVWWLESEYFMRTRRMSIIWGLFCGFCPNVGLKMARLMRAYEYCDCICLNAFPQCSHLLRHHLKIWFPGLALTVNTQSAKLILK